MNIKNYALTVGMLIVGVVAGAAIFGDFQPKDAKSDDASVEAKSDHKDKIIRQLKNRIEELESRRRRAPRKEEFKEQIEETQINAPEEAQNSMPRPGDVQDFVTRLERENPERFAEITNRVHSFRRRRAEQVQNKLEFLSSIDVSQMNESARKVHAQLQEKLAEMEETESMIHSSDITMEERIELFGKIREMRQDLNRLNEQERDNLISAAAKGLGLNDQDAADVAVTIKEIYSATETSFGGWGRGNRGRPGGPGRGGNR